MLTISTLLGQRNGLLHYVDTQRMYVALHQVADRFIDEPMALNWPQALEFGRADLYPEMSPAVLRSGMPGMQVAFVNDLEIAGF